MSELKDLLRLKREILKGGVGDFADEIARMSIDARKQQLIEELAPLEKAKRCRNDEGPAEDKRAKSE